MADAEPFPLLLLGAGASRPAGVPTALEMTRKMMEMCEADDQRDYLRALNALAGGLQMGVGQSEFTTSGDADVEQVLNAASLLGDRFDLEFAPFVAAWHPIIEELERRKFGSWEAQRIVRRAMSGLSLDRIPRSARPEEAIRTAVEGTLQIAIMGIGDYLSLRPDGALFRGLMTYLTGKLVELTWLRSPEKLAYLDPLLTAARDTPITVATLNYDNGIELRASSLAVPCETGIDVWSETGSFRRAPTGIDLMKLHGSVKWWWSMRNEEDPIGLRYREFIEVDDAYMEQITKQDFRMEILGQQFAAIFGGRNKLTAEGPFLDLLIKFKKVLDEHWRLLVIGYSFRDAHVNQCIVRWLGTDAS